jgi:hypothetical protein
VIGIHKGEIRIKPKARAGESSSKKIVVNHGRLISKDLLLIFEEVVNKWKADMFNV